MTDFDDRFADRVREVFDGHKEAVDEAAWARMQAALGAVAGPPVSAASGARPAPDRAPVAQAHARRTRGLAVLAALLVVGGAGLWGLWQTAQAPDDVSEVAMADARETVASPARPEDSDAPDADTLPADAPTLTTPRIPAAETPDLALASPRAAPPVPNELATPPSAAPAARQNRSMPAASGAFLGREIAAVPDAARARSLVGAPADRSSAPDAEPQTAPDVRDAVVIGGATDRPVPSVSAETAAAPSPLVSRQPDPQGLDAISSARGDDVAKPRPMPDPAASPERTSHVGIVLATNAAFSGRQLAEGVGVTGGVSGEWRLGRGLSVSTGAQAAYTTLSIDEGAVGALDEAVSFSDLEASPTRSLDVTSQSTLSTLALEVPVDLGLSLVRVGRGRVRAGAGVTTSLYLAQSFRDEGQRYSLGPATESAGAGAFVSRADFSETETEAPFSRFDIARQMNLSLGYSLDRGRVPLSLDAYTRLPLGGVTSRNLPLTSVGVRLRVGL